MGYFAWLPLGFSGLVRELWWKGMYNSEWVVTGLSFERGPSF